MKNWFSKKRKVTDGWYFIKIFFGDPQYFGGLDAMNELIGGEFIHLYTYYIPGSEGNKLKTTWYENTWNIWFLRVLTWLENTWTNIC